MKDVLIVRIGALLKPAKMHEIREAVTEQIKTGVVVLPAYCKAELINVPEDIEVIVESSEEIDICESIT